MNRTNKIPALLFCLLVAWWASSTYFPESISAANNGFLILPNPAVVNTVPVVTGTTPGAITYQKVPAAAMTPAGADTQVQFNNAGAFGASPNFTWDGTTLTAVSTATTTPRGINAAQYDNGTNSARLGGYKARGTLASPTILTTADLLTRWSGFGYDGANFLESASIVFGTQGTVASTRMPSYIAFSTSTDAAPSVLTESARFTSLQNLLLGGVTDGNFRFDVQKSGTSGSGQIFDRTASTGSSLFNIRAGAGQGSNNFLQFQNNAGSLWGGFTLGGQVALFVNGSAGGNAASALTSIGVSSMVNGLIGFTSGTNANSTQDTSLARNAAGIIEINNGTAGTFRNLKLNYVQTVPIATASLVPCAAGTAGVRAAVNDALAPAVGVALTGGGAIFATVHCSSTTNSYIVDGL